MGRKTVLVDDFDGKELSDDTQPVNLSLGRTTYRLYLSEKNYGKLLDAVNPFIENAETVQAAARKSTASGTGRGNSTVDTYGYPVKDVREWARANNIKNDNGNPVADRGRISQGVYDQYKAAQ